ncbi:YciI family protein [Planctomicrobium sp. SH527]|uniref:YciI family protein n=1 Tax=Planctomicrobium sp. SH527 TaxID=3448123 RepID=UPI003F5B2C84
MKFICLGYADPEKFNQMSESELAIATEECLSYDDELRWGGHFIGGEALQAPANAVTIRGSSGKVVITDGPFTETKEFLGGILLLEARDLNHAIALMSKHPGVRLGSFEIRPADDEFMKMVEARKRSLENQTA